ERSDTPTDPDDWQRVTKAIVSHDRARSRRHAEEILRHRWDLVIVDEAHKVKSQRGATYQFIERIERDFILLLTATPLQNDLRELYNLIDRKSTRLNSSHGSISYAVFCLNKKTPHHTTETV